MTFNPKKKIASDNDVLQTVLENYFKREFSWGKGREQEKQLSSHKDTLIKHKPSHDSLLRGNSDMGQQVKEWVKSTRGNIKAFIESNRSMDRDALGKFLLIGIISRDGYSSTTYMQALWYSLVLEPLAIDFNKAITTENRDSEDTAGWFSICPDTAHILYMKNKGGEKQKVELSKKRRDVFDILAKAPLNWVNESDILDRVGGSSGGALSKTIQRIRKEFPEGIRDNVIERKKNNYCLLLRKQEPS